MILEAIKPKNKLVFENFKETCQQFRNSKRTVDVFSFILQRKQQLNHFISLLMNYYIAKPPRYIYVCVWKFMQ